MTTTYKNATTQQMMNAIKGSNGSFITIPKHIIESAVTSGALIEKGRHRSRNDNYNIYYHITGTANDMLMHVQNDMYVLISRYVYCEKLNKEIDTLPILLEMSFSSGRTNENRCHVMASLRKKFTDVGLKKTAYLTRVLTSLELYGELRNLNSTFDVHHKGDCFDNRQDMTLYIPREEHKHRDSHMNGIEIRSYQGLLSLLKAMENSYQRLYWVTTVA